MWTIGTGAAFRTHPTVHPLPDGEPSPISSTWMWRRGSESLHALVNLGLAHESVGNKLFVFWQESKVQFKF